MSDEVPARSAGPVVISSERARLRADLAEAVALLREARPIIFVDADLMASVEPDGSSAHGAFARVTRIDALLARHPCPAPEAAR